MTTTTTDNNNNNDQFALKNPNGVLLIIIIIMPLIHNVILVNYIHYSSRTLKVYNKLYTILTRDKTNIKSSLGPGLSANLFCFLINVCWFSKIEFIIGRFYLMELCWFIKIGFIFFIKIVRNKCTDSLYTNLSDFL